MTNFIDLSNKEFGKLTVMHRGPDREYASNKLSTWVCKCVCGNEIVALACNLRTGNTQSCGCYRVEKTVSRSWKGHGEIGSVYWNQIKRHAKNRNLDFDITIEDAWQAFLDQERKCALTGLLLTMKSATQEQTASLDRIDSNLGYEPSNIQWVHKKVNEIKWDMQVNELYDWCELLLKHKETKWQRIMTNSVHA